MASISYTRISEFAKAIGLHSASNNSFVGFVAATADWGTLRKEGSRSSWTSPKNTISAVTTSILLLPIISTTWSCSIRLLAE